MMCTSQIATTSTFMARWQTETTPNEMNNKEYIAELSRRTGFSQDNTQRMVRCVIESMAQQFDDGENVTVPDFGTFELKNRMERIVVNPSTGQRMMVPPKSVLSFKPVASVKNKMKKGEQNG